MSDSTDLVDRRYLPFRSSHAEAFERSSRRRRHTPNVPDDIAETNLRVGRLESIASKLLSALAALMGSNAFEYDQRQRLEDTPYRLAVYELTRVPGIGEEKAHRLVRCFGSLAGLYDASAEEIAYYVPGVGVELASRIKEYLRRL